MTATPVTPDLLRCLPLPRPGDDADKEERGRVLVVAGAVDLPGAAVLAGTAALRAGAGKLQIATCASIAGAVGVAVPECRAIPLPETEAGGIAPEAAPAILHWAKTTQAFLIGPGMHFVPAVEALFRAVLPKLDAPAVVLDGCALTAIGADRSLLRRGPSMPILTPHAGEMARLMNVTKERVRAEPLTLAREAARELGGVVMLKGSETYVVTPEGEAWCYGGGHVGLATSGSGDTLAGIVAGLLARGAEPAQAAAWAAFLHGEAGNRLEARHGLVGFLARELLDEIPGVMASVDPGQST